jgi:glycosyltransferase involved in cell wall biosynthesis
MSSARAVVASAIPQNMEVAKQGDEIILVDPRNVGEISCVIARLLADESERKKLGEKARKTILKCYDWKTTAKKTLRLYENVVGN